MIDLLVRSALILMLCGSLSGQSDPGAEEDAAMERRKLLRMADQVELLTEQNSELTQEVRSLRQKVDAANKETAALRSRLGALEKHWAKEKEALLAKVAELIEKNAAKTSPPSRNSEFYEHTVSSGDSLWAIAQAYRDQLGTNVSAEDIRLANGLKKGQYLKVGQKIKVPKR